MRKPKIDSFARITNLIVVLETRRESLAEMKRLLDELQRGGIVVVAGEAAAVGRLDERHSATMKLIGSVEQKAGASAEAALGQLEDWINCTEWLVYEELKRKAERQKEVLRPYLEQLTKWRGLIDNLQQLLAEGVKARAPVFAEQRDVQRYEACVSAAERALREQQYRHLLQSLDGLPRKFDTTEAIRRELREKIDRTRQFSRQADLLVLQSPLDTQLRRYRYTMLLRTASETGSHGINIQDSSTLVEQDRNAMREIISRVTEAIDRGLARDFAMRKAGVLKDAASAPSAVEPSELAVSANVPSPDVTRRFAPEEEKATVLSPVQINVLLQDMGDLMFRLFMPEWMQRYLEDTPCAVMITTNDLELPWELMSCSGKFLCLDRPTSRMPMGRALPRPKPKSPGLAGHKLRFLLIYSDPEGTLPAAGSEIETLSQKLKAEWGERIEVVVIARHEATGERLNNELRKGGFDVIHYAGHAAFDVDSPDLSGLLVCDGSGHKEVFFAQKVRRLLEGRPLVFLNACQSGRAANEQEALRTDYLLDPAEGLASAFLYGGALACVGSLWPIFDRPAAEFALEFYRKALEGYMLGEAMRLARIEIREKWPNQITWAAFALYGDATFRLAD